MELTQEQVKQGLIATKITDLNISRDKELVEGFVIDGIFLNEEIIKTMAVAYTITPSGQTIDWIDVNNNPVKLTKEKMQRLIAQGSQKVKEIYFKYRQLKDEALKGEK